MMTIRNIEAVIFDMDGTLVDSELLTDRVVQQLLEQHGIATNEFDCSQCHGITWKKVEALLQSSFPQLSKLKLAEPLHDRFHALGKELEPDAIPGAQLAVQAAHQVARTAIGTSSNRESLQEVVRRLKLADFLTTTVSAEDYEDAKPAPDCYLLLAKRLDVAPSNCLVFEDSVPGIESARAAGMTVIAITHRCAALELVTELADGTVGNYTELPANFFAEACDG